MSTQPEKKENKLNELYEQGKAKGTMTYDEIITKLSTTDIDPDQFDTVLETLEAMGDVVVDWQEARQTAVVLTGTAEEVTALAVPIGSSRAYQMTGTVADFEAIGVSTDNIDWDRGQIITLDVPAQIVENRTMVPLRLISEALGYKVTWDAITQTVLVEPVLAAEGDDTSDAALF